MTGLPHACVRVALVGAGTIAARYVESLRATPGFAAVTVCARRAASAQAFAAEHGLVAASFDAMLADPGIDYVLNLTPAADHETVTRACLEAGKPVYSEKPLAATLAAADALIALAEARGLLLACAPATFLWPPYATARRLVEEGRLGRIAGALSVLVYPGPEIFHPSPAHLYGEGAGPLRDMGVYQVTVLTALLGPVVAVSAMTGQARTTRTVLVGPDAGQSFDVPTPTDIHALLRHASGATTSLIVSFDALSAGPARLDIFGEKAGLSIVDSHMPTARLFLSETLGDRREQPLDGLPFTAAAWGVGVTSAWDESVNGQPVAASARRARDTLAVLLTIDREARIFGAH